MPDETPGKARIKRELSQRERARLMSMLFVSPGEAAQLCGIGRTTLYRMTLRGEVPVQYFRSKPRIPVAWIRERAAGRAGT